MVQCMMEATSDCSTESCDIRDRCIEIGSEGEDSYISIPDFRAGVLQDRQKSRSHRRNMSNQSEVLDAALPKEAPEGHRVSQTGQEWRGLSTKKSDDKDPAFRFGFKPSLLLRLRIRNANSSVDQGSMQPRISPRYQHTSQNTEASEGERKVQSLADVNEQASVGQPSSRVVLSTSGVPVQGSQICGTTSFANPQVNKGRSSTGSKPFKCPQCNKGFTGRKRIRDHIRFVHEGVKPYVCRVPGCKRASTSAHANRQHYDTVHLCLQQHKCRVEGCDASFGQVSHRNRHERNIHKLDFRN